MGEKIFDKVVELSADLLEPAWDEIFKDPILKDVPVLGTAVKAASLVQGISDRLFFIKITRFLEALDRESRAKAKEFAGEIQCGNEDANRVAETLLLAIDKIDDLQKAPVLAAIFASFLRGEMSKADLRRLIFAVNSAAVDDILTLASIGLDPSGRSKECTDALTALQHTGLSQAGVEFVVTEKDADISDMITPLGQKFLSAAAGIRSK